MKCSGLASAFTEQCVADHVTVNSHFRHQRRGSASILLAR